MRIFEDTYKTPDDLSKYLEGLGHTGTLNDKMFKYLVSQGYFGALADMIPQAPSSPSGGSTWILALGSWDDTGEWDDTDIWNDA